MTHRSERDEKTRNASRRAIKELGVGTERWNRDGYGNCVRGKRPGDQRCKGRSKQQGSAWFDSTCSELFLRGFSPVVGHNPTISSNSNYESGETPSTRFCNTAAKTYTAISTHTRVLLRRIGPGTLRGTKQQRKRNQCVDRLQSRNPTQLHESSATDPGDTGIRNGGRSR